MAEPGEPARGSYGFFDGLMKETRRKPGFWTCFYVFCECSMGFLDMIYGFWTCFTGLFDMLSVVRAVRAVCQSCFTSFETLELLKRVFPVQTTRLRLTKTSKRVPVPPNRWYLEAFKYPKNHQKPPVVGGSRWKL